MSEFPSFQEEIIQLYYPFLYLKNIISFDQLESSEELLKESSKKILNENILRNFENIDLFFDIYKNKKTNLNYKISGVQYIKTVIHPEYEIKIPLEVIFKILHATERNPLIKYNASSRQENVYRLYTDKISTDGRKIPFLSKSTILKLIKTIGKTKSVSVYIESPKDSSINSFIIDFDEDGVITISSEFSTLVKLEFIEQLLKDTVNPIIVEIRDYLQESGYKINIFNSFLDSFIEIQQLNYQTQIEIHKNININQIKSCIQSAFIIESNVAKKDIQLRFKRVSVSENIETG